MGTLNNKNILLSLMILISVTSFVFASCGSCQVKVKHSTLKKSNSLLTTIPESGEIEGFAITSCGMCNFAYKGSKGCSLTIKIGDTVYPVEGSSLHEHGDPHSEEGMCSAVKVAYVSGKIKKDKFYSDSFTIVESPQ
tara:strand:- start:880 stop:1290 length:411 start_codon:yes stop_codon:yes gene_type:complete